MIHEKEIKRQDGSRVRIMVRPSVDSFGYGPIEYEVVLMVCEPRKRTFRDVYSGDDWNYRKLSMSDRKEWIKEQQLKHATEQEIYEAKIELWNLLKPHQP